MALIDPRKKKKAAGTTWIGRDNKIIQAREGTNEKVGDHISKHRPSQKKTSTVKGGQGGTKSRYSSGVDQSKRKELLLKREKTLQSIKSQNKARNNRRGGGVRNRK